LKEILFFFLPKKTYSISLHERHTYKVNMSTNKKNKFFNHTLNLVLKYRQKIIENFKRFKNWRKKYTRIKIKSWNI